MLQIIQSKLQVRLIVSTVWIIGARVERTTFYAVSNRPRYNLPPHIMKVCYLLKQHCRFLQATIKCVRDEKKSAERENLFRSKCKNNHPLIDSFTTRRAFAIFSRQFDGKRNIRDAYSRVIRTYDLSLP